MNLLPYTIYVSFAGAALALAAGTRSAAAARWVEDGKYFTSSGVSAGMDMALGLIAKLLDRATAEDIARGAEYEWNSDPDRDPFAKLNGLAS